MVELDDVALEARHCRLTTTGRVTGRRHTAQLWFVPADGGVFLLSGSGGLRQWCLDLVAEEQAVVEVGNRRFQARAGAVTDPEIRRLALEQFADKYDVDPERHADRTADATLYRLVFLREVLA